MLNARNSSSETASVHGTFRVSIVVPCRDRAGQLAVCLAATARLDPAPVEIIVVDSGSRNREHIRNLAIEWHARYLHLDRSGVSHAKNAGSRAAVGDVVAYLDDDSVPAPDWLAHLIAPFRDPRVAVVTGRVEPDPGSPFDRAEYELVGYIRGTGGPVSVSTDDANWFEIACFGGIGISPNLAVRREIFDTGCRFNERLGLGAAVPAGEEGHLFLTIVRRGLVLRHVPEALVFHPVPGPSRESLRRRYRLALAASTAYLLMILCEESGCRWPAFKYLAKKCGRLRPIWKRVTISGRQAAIIPAWQVIIARAWGVLLYSLSLPRAAINHNRTRRPPTAIPVNDPAR